MGFEQLAALKDQLAKQAEEKRASARKARAGRPAPAAKRDASAPAQNGAANNDARAQHAAAPKDAGQNRSGQNRSNRNGPNQNGAKQASAQKSKPVDPVVLSIGKLQKRFPKAFPKNPAPKLPLKVGIFKDLLQHTEELGLDEAALRDAIKVWCWGSRYWACIVENAMRVDLNGEDAGQVLPAEASRARGLQAKRQKSKNAAQNSTASQNAAAVQGDNASQGETVLRSDSAAQVEAVSQGEAAAESEGAPQENAAQHMPPAQPSGSEQQDSATQ